MDPSGHLVTLKVMRVSRPSLSSYWQPFFSSSPSFSAQATVSPLSLQGNVPLSGHPKTLRDLTHTLPFLALPSSFGAVQLGETFSSCLCLNNDSDTVIPHVQLRVEMQTATSKVLLQEITGSLDKGDILESVIQHEIKEVGQHVLACSIQYHIPDVGGTASESMSQIAFNKFYKFNATNPLSVKTKVHVPKSSFGQMSLQEREKVFLEVHIQNLTSTSLWFERVELLPEVGLSVQDAHAVATAKRSNGFGSTALLSGPNSILQPKDIRQYLYVLYPEEPRLFPPQHSPGTVIPLGRLDISWRSFFGEPGRLVTSMLSRKIKLLETRSPISAIPPHLQVVHSPKPRNPASLTGSRPDSPFSPRSSTASPPISSNNSAVPPPPPKPPKIEFEADVDLAITSLSHTVVRMGQELQIEFLLACSASVTFSERNGGQLQFIVQHTRHPLKTSAMAINTAEIASILNSPPPLPLKEPQEESPTSIQSNKSLDAVRLPRLDDDDLPISIDPEAIMFLGDSAEILPPLQLEQISGQDKVQGQLTFTLYYTAIQPAFTAVGGLRLFIIEDVGSRKFPRLLRKWDALADVWIRH